ncbi:C-type lectin-like [Trinorchestia longiramus]|nr:C-type lectin-like [Trinorchestia longiramus]
MEALSGISMDRKWTNLQVNMTYVYSGNFTQITTSDITICILHASRSLPVNLMCQKSSTCIFSATDLPRSEGYQTEGFTCFYLQVCSYEGMLLKEGENVNPPDPECAGTRTLTCSKHGMIPRDIPVLRTMCTPPFTQYEFGCMYDSDFTGTYCEVRQYCENLGANLASPETAEDCTAMTEYYNNKHGSQKSSYFVGLFKVDGVWRWPVNNRDPGPPNEGDWDRTQPNNDGNAGVMFKNISGKYSIADTSEISVRNVICHVWGLH